MSELWRELIERESPALARGLSLSRVSISKSTGKMTVRLASGRILSRKEYKTLKNCFESAFPAIGVNVDVRYPELKSKVEEDINAATPLFKDLLSHACPGAVHFLDWNSGAWKFDGDRLLINSASSEGAQYLRMKGIDRVFEGWLKDLFGIEKGVVIKITGDDERRIVEINEARAKEAEMLAMDTAKVLEAEPKKAPPSDAIYGKTIHDPSIPMSEVTEDIGRMTVTGEVSGLDIKDAKNGMTKIISFSMSDNTSSINCKLFLSGKRGADESAKSIQAQADALSAALKDGNWVKVRGSYRYDDFKHEMMLMVSDIMPAEKPVRKDTASEKRVELHLHTSFSTMDACASPSDLIKQAAKWGHKAIAITDHGVVQAYPEAFGAAKKNNIKLIPGCEGYLIDDAASIVDGDGSIPIQGTAFVVLDVETTGLNTHTDEIIEIGAVRIENGVEVAEFSELICPERSISEKITEITGITNAMLRGKPRLAEVMPAFAKFCEGAVLVAHNAPFDIAFFRRAFRDSNLPFEHSVIDTLALVRNQYPNFKNHKLGNVCKQLGISLTNAHRAVHDARATSLVLVRVL
ncbi:MAG: PHP domain-containing protein, partial [Clostridia bacterium]|nr:PHP domain-containing protein [Clostridia bacterium]